MYIHIIYYAGDRSLIESISDNSCPGLIGNRTFLLNGVDNDVDALRFLLHDGNHFDVIFLHGACADRVYEEILNAIREDRKIIELDIRDLQVEKPPYAENTDC